ncbi:hypothetical protein [Lentibacillus sp. Marseille-P4043]|uniref:hypothetical protein n=1 Tax=Lentibacillus sp. Marseille-P4043 TaxID=2040293 RepID=UPI00131A54FE|nr:hypothetical protein [Lentibacillus sp. Marseille-P4043]
MADSDLWKHQPERGNINPNTRTSARVREHRPESRKHQPERGNIDRCVETSTRSRLRRESNFLITSLFLSTTKFKKQQTLRNDNSQFTYRLMLK